MATTTTQSPRTRSSSRRYTFEEWLATPETQRRYEILDGEWIMAATPTMEHQWLAQHVAELLLHFIRPRRLGVVIVAPFDLLIRREPLRTRQPDVLFISAKRKVFRKRSELRINYLEVPPDLVIEILSTSNRPRDLTQKLREYGRLGVNECWLLYSKTEAIEVLRLTQDGPEAIGRFSSTDVVRSEVLPDLILRVDEVFTEELD